jgi:hypothetical protein
MAICTRCAQAAAEAAEIRTAQRMVVDAVLVVEAGADRHLSSRRHRDRPRWRASQRGRWRRQWWWGARGWGQCWWRCRKRYGAVAEQEVVECGAASAGSSAHVAGGGRARGAPESCAAAKGRGGARRLPGRGSPALAAAASPGARRRWRGGARWGREGGGGAALRAGLGAALGRCSAAAQGAREGDWFADCGQRRRFPPTHCPPPAEPPSAALPAPLADPTPGPAAARCRPGSARRPPAPVAADIQCCGRWRTRCARRPLELQSGRRYYQQKGIEACLHSIYS